ncbi:MAG TPA: DUF1761 domain-containing protein, partial [Hellea balneolensis]|nr:DUF1761 domain-containing protein [Hellea balneolensis]
MRIRAIKFLPYIRVIVSVRIPNALVRTCKPLVALCLALRHTSSYAIITARLKGHNIRGEANMPKIFGTSLIGILAASVVFFMLGWLWYGIIFQEMWMGLAGITETEPNPMTMVWGFVITVVQVLGIAFVLNHAGA